MILQGDCVEKMRELGEASVDAIVTDPPYFLGFMGKAWDIATPGDLQHGHDRWATEALRVLKPGGHLLAFGGTRTYHRLACAIEDAGFEIRDCIVWMYGSGFPKSLDVSKAIDKAAGAEREVVGESQYAARRAKQYEVEAEAFGNAGPGLTGPGSTQLTAPATPEAAQWEGWGTALKPAHEPIVLARKPLSGTVSQTVLEHGTGALNIDGCRIGTDEQLGRLNHTTSKFVDSANGTRDAHPRTINVDNSGGLGRWPANVALSHLPECQAVGMRKVKTGTAVRRNIGHSDKGNIPFATGSRDAEMTDDVTYGADGTETIIAWECAPDCPIAMLDEQSGETGGGFATRGASSRIYGGGKGFTEATGEEVGYGDSGGASRFFYCAKSSRGERNAGLDGFEESEAARKVGKNKERQCRVCGNRSKPANYIGGDTRPWPSCGHDDWEWQEFLAERHHGSNRNSHPTVKPIDLMRWLVRLVTPRGGTVLDPFAGSGTTGIAAVLEGFEFTGIEREAEYCEIAQARIEWWSQWAGEDTEAILIRAGLSERIHNGHKEAGQLGLLDGPHEPVETPVEGKRSVYGFASTRTIPRCVEHDAALPSGSNTYSCGCGIQYEER